MSGRAFLDRQSVCAILVSAGMVIGALFGCSEDSNPADPVDPDSIVDFTDPVALIDAHARSLELMNLDRYAALLASDFVYVPQDEDAADFPWITPDDPWERADELGMIGHMMDSTFVSQETGDSVDSIEMALMVRNQQHVADGLEVTCDAAIQVLWAEGTGARCDVRLVFLLAADDGGHLRIRQIAELPAHKRALSIEESSWGAVKSLYR